MGANQTVIFNDVFAKLAQIVQVLRLRVRLQPATVDSPQNNRFGFNIDLDVNTRYG